MTTWTANVLRRLADWLELLEFDVPLACKLGLHAFATRVVNPGTFMAWTKTPVCKRCGTVKGFRHPVFEARA